ncbi:MAG: AsmA-like C-terminal region-containing protein [Desulfobacteraceae bacterium]|nr:AsmA-like C-terminal region-containing protein [Desulfobacteraceae bacterium]
MFLLKAKNKIKILCHVILVFSILLILLINSFPWFLNIKYIQNQLFQIITHQNQISANTNDIDFDLFPVPALRLRDLTLKTRNNTTFSIKTILIYPDLKKMIKGKPVINKIFIMDYKLDLKLKDRPPSAVPDPIDFLQTNQIKKFINKDKGLSILIHNSQYDFAEKFDASITINNNQKITGNLLITNFALNKEVLVKYGLNKNIFNLDSQQNKDLIILRNLKTNFNITKDQTQITVTPTIFEYPSMTLGIEFLYDRKTNKAQIEFSGKNVDINQAKNAYFDLFNKEEVSENLFDIVRAGNASKITVFFKEKDLRNLFRPENMILNGQVENGDIKIPNTQLIPEKVFGTALIKKGMLYINAEKGNLKNAVINNGTLEIDLLNQVDFPFRGSFKINAPILDIQKVLMELFPETLLAEELKLVTNIEGIVDGDLHLELKTGDDLDVIVIVEDTRGSGEYRRAPGKIKINMGKFQYKNNMVTLTDFGGKIGKSYFYNFTGSYALDDTNLIDIRSGNALIDSNEIFNWLTGFKNIKTFVPDLAIGTGYFGIDSTTITGDILKPDELKFNVKGSCEQTLIEYTSIEQSSIRQSNQTRGIFLSSCDFQISDQLLFIENIDAEISDTRLISNFTLNKEIENITTPFTLSNASYKSTEGSETFIGELEFLNGPKINLATEKNNRGSFSLKKLSIIDNLDTNVKFATDIENNINFFKFDGQINTKTLEKIFKSESPPYQKLIDYTDEKKILIKSKEKSSYTIFADVIDIEPLIKNLFIKNKTSVFSSEQRNTTFPEKHIKLQADSLKYKKSDFNDFQTNVGIQRNTNGLNGKFNLTTKDGTIHRLTLVSRILSVINISTFFKGELPDVKQQGFKYNSINVKAKIVNNIIILEEALIDGHDMALVFKGTIDPVKNDLDLTCLVAPFKTIDLLIERIPLVNTMLDNNLISIPVKISGKINDPSVVPLHPVSVGKGLMNLMTNIIKTPFKLWEKLPGNGNKKKE